MELSKKKELFMKMKSFEANAKELLQRGGKFKLDELKVILKYHQVKRVSTFKLAEAEAELEKIGRETPAPAYEIWTDADETRLLHLTT